MALIRRGAVEPLDLPSPPLADELLQLRPWVLADARALVRAWKDPDIAEFSAVPDDVSLSAAERWIAGDARRRHARFALDLVVSPVGSDAVMGEVGLAEFRADGRAAMIGYWAHLTYRRQGMTTRAVDLLSTWALTTLGLDLLVARCHPDNEGSHAVMRNVGYSLARNDPDGNHLFVLRASRSETR